MIPMDFIVPKNDPLWPEKWWGYKLGQRYLTLRHAESLPSWQTPILEHHGIPLDTQRIMKGERLLTALQAYMLNTRGFALSA
jgi:hypothetical protein